MFEHDATDLLPDPALICSICSIAPITLSLPSLFISVPFLFFFVEFVGLDWSGREGKARFEVRGHVAFAI